MNQLLKTAAERAAHYLNTLKHRAVGPTSEARVRLAQFEEPLPEKGAQPEDVIALLDEIGSPATMASAGPRFFGFVVGGSLPAALAANWMAGAWDQNADLTVLSPTAAKLEEVSMRWALDVLGLPPGCGVGFVTCATQANFSGLAAEAAPPQPAMSL
jgi:glutamate/tyrosine decarboxylase-like PLP-dependent enzyme